MSQATPRIAPLEPPYPLEIQMQFDRIMRGAPPLMLFRVMAGYARAWDKFRAGGLLDPDRTCALNRCEYEWGVHVEIFAGPAKLTEDEVCATVQGDAMSQCWSPPEQALIAAVDALHHRATLSDDEFATLSAHYDEAQILEMMLLCGFYRTVSYLANGLRLPLEEKAARFPGQI